MLLLKKLKTNYVQVMPKTPKLTQEEIELLKKLLEKLNSNQINTLQKLISNSYLINNKIKDIEIFYHQLFLPNQQNQILANVFKEYVEEKLHKAEEADSLIEKLNKTLDESDTLLNEKKKALNTLTTSIKDLEEQVTSLLPASLAVGLSASYKEAQSNYKYSKYKIKTSGANQGKWVEKEEHEKKHDKYWYILKNLGRYVAFLAPLLCILIINLEPNWFNSLNPIKEPKDIFTRILLMLPLAVISWFGWSSIKRNNFLLEEYHHKEKIMSLYQGISEKISGNDESLLQLNKMIIASIYSNPNTKQNKHSKELINNILSILSNKTKNKITDE